MTNVCVDGKAEPAGDTVLEVDRDLVLPAERKTVMKYEQSNEMYISYLGNARRAVTSLHEAVVSSPAKAESMATSTTSAASSGRETNLAEHSSTARSTAT